MTFPVSPNKGDTHTSDDTVFVYNGVSWDRSVIGSNNATDYSSDTLHDRLAALEGLPFLAGYATETYVGTQVANLIDSAPGTLDTLNELAAAIGDDANYVTTIASNIAAVQAEVDANETAAAALVTTLETARNVITTAISARVTTLEADPTTATALAAVQADVNQNESDADSAIANVSTNLNNEGAARLLADNAIQADVDANEAERKTYFAWESNLSKVINPLRGSRIDVGNNITFYPAAGYNTEIKGNLLCDNNTDVFVTLTDATDDSAAATAGVAVNQLYRNGSVVMIRVS